MIQELINRYKRMCTERFLRQTYQYSYAFIGMGQHSLTNLYPVLQYLGVPLKYICVTSEKKKQLIERKYPYVKATTSLDEILNDETIKGVFVSTTPSAHFSIASQVLQNGKSLFIEKPPCQTLEELDALIDLQQQYGSPVAMVGNDSVKSVLSATTYITSQEPIQKAMPCSISTSIPSTSHAICSVSPKSLPARRSP